MAWCGAKLLERRGVVHRNAEIRCSSATESSYEELRTSTTGVGTLCVFCSKMIVRWGKGAIVVAAGGGYPNRLITCDVAATSIP